MDLDRFIVRNAGDCLAGQVKVQAALSEGLEHVRGKSVDFEVGDDYSPSGTAMGGGNDTINSGLKNDLVIGDSYTDTGTSPAEPDTPATGHD